MSETNLKFDDLPKALAWIIDKLKDLEHKVDGLVPRTKEAPPDEWLNLRELCDYLPSHPAFQTVYGWTSCHQIPYHKKGKRIMFLKSEIDDWLHSGKMKSQRELEQEASNFIQIKKKSKL